jgi:hypothetical protein
MPNYLAYGIIFSWSISANFWDIFNLADEHEYPQRETIGSCIESKDVQPDMHNRLARPCKSHEVTARQKPPYTS